MKKLLIGLAVVVVLIVAAAFVIPFFVPLDTYKSKIIALVKDETGRDLRIDGPVNFSLLPRVALEANAVALSNPAGASTPNMVQLKTLDVTLRLLPLLHGAIEVDQFKLVEPAITLEVDKEGRPNWAFSRAVQPASRAGPSPSEPSGKGGGVPAISLGDVSIVNGQASYLDQRSGEKRVVTDINLQLSLPDLAGPFEAKGGATWNAEPVALTFNVAHPGALVGGGASPLVLSIASRPVNFDFRGDATGATLAKLLGTIDLTVPSVRDLAKWVGVPFAPPGTGFGALSIAGKIAVADQKIAFTDAALTLDTVKATGALTLDSRGARPYLAGRLDIDKLDVNPYLPVEQPAASAVPASPTEATPAPEGLSPPAANPHGWSDAPIELSGLKAADADFDLSANSILYRKIEIGKSALTLHLKNGRFEADLTEMELYQGKGKGTVVADGSEPIPAITAAFNLTGIAIQPLLRDAAAFERLTGTGGFVLDVAGRGRSEREIVASLNGKGSLNLADGKIEGVNFVAFMKNVASAVTGGHGGSNETEFGALTGTYTISEGILHNNDLKLISPELPMSGAGSVDLPLRQVDYRLTPSLAGLIAVPVSITGSWDDLSYRPDLSAMGKTLIEQPEKALDLLKNGLLGR
jgi:AsmA protein